MAAPTTEAPVALFLPSLHGGGAERVMVELSRGLSLLGQERGFRVELVLAKAEGAYLDEVPEAVRVIDLGHRRTSRALPSLARYLRRTRPRALLSTMSHANVVALAARALARGPHRALVREADTFSEERLRSLRLKDRVEQAAIRLLYPRAYGVVACSEDVREHLGLHLGLPKERISVIANPTNFDKIAELAEEDPAHEWLTEGSSSPVVMGMGRLHWSKGFLPLLEAFATLRRGRPARLMILGEGEDREALVRRAKELGIEEDLALPGFVKNPFAYLNRARLFAFPSRYEGMPNALIQAIALGLPSVATDCPGASREVIEGAHPRTRSALVPLDAPEALAEAMIRAFEEGEKALPPASWRARYESHAVAARYAELLGL